MRPVNDRMALRLVQAVADEAGAQDGDGQKTRLIVEELIAHDWASATFIGALHGLHLRLEGPQAAVAEACERLRQRLAKREIPLPGHFVAEIALTLGNPLHLGESLIEMPLTVNVLVLQE
jgi:hypothetical protein